MADGGNIACTAGTYYNAGSAKDAIEICQKCPPGHECPNASLAPTACSSGEYKVGEGAGSC